VKKRDLGHQVDVVDVQGISSGALSSTREDGYDDGNDMRGSKMGGWGWSSFEFFFYPGFLLYRSSIGFYRRF